MPSSRAEAEARALEDLEKQKEEAELAVLNALATEKAAANVLDAMTTTDHSRLASKPVRVTKGGLEVLS